jgi:hypothetical protein
LGLLSAGRIGPYAAGYWAAIITSDGPIRLEDVEGLLTVAGIPIKKTASSIDKHVDALVRKTKRTAAAKDDVWLRASALAIKAFVLAARTGKVDAQCFALDTLIRLGWDDVIARLSGGMIKAAEGNLPPFHGQLGREGRNLLARLRKTSEKA